MRVLLDTHTFLWWDAVRTNLSVTALAVCEDEANILVVSVISLWEIQVKVAPGKLTLRVPLREMLRQQQETNEIEIMSVLPAHIFALDGLPFHHKDPFDRLLIAQAIHEHLPIISHDSLMSQYPVTVIR